MLLVLPFSMIFFVFATIINTFSLVSHITLTWKIVSSLWVWGPMLTKIYNFLYLIILLWHLVPNKVESSWIQLLLFIFNRVLYMWILSKISRVLFQPNMFFGNIFWSINALTALNEMTYKSRDQFLYYFVHDIREDRF